MHDMRCLFDKKNYFLTYFTKRFVILKSIDFKNRIFKIALTEKLCLGVQFQ